jgi:hypothetical protein
MGWLKEPREVRYIQLALRRARESGMETKRESGGLATLTHSSKDTAKVKSGLGTATTIAAKRTYEIRD